MTLPLREAFRKKFHRPLIMYYDDAAIRLSGDLPASQQELKVIVRLFEEHGFVLSIAKMFGPHQSGKFLAFTVNSDTMSLEVHKSAWKKSMLFQIGF